MEEQKQVFGDMQVLHEVASGAGGKARVRVKCNKCGTERDVELGSLKGGKGTQHGMACSRVVKPSEEHKRLHRIWASMRTRTTNVKHGDYKDYGGRSINSDEWEFFIDFFYDMQASYYASVKLVGEKNTSLERRDNDGNYCKENCTWASQKEQCANQRPKNTQKHFRVVDADGKESYWNSMTAFKGETGAHLETTKKHLANGTTPTNYRSRIRGWYFYPCEPTDSETWNTLE